MTYRLVVLFARSLDIHLASVMALTAWTHTRCCPLNYFSASALVGGRRGSGAREHCVLIHEVKPAVVVGVVVGGGGNDGCVQRCE
jgi:hypothetical protein